MRETNTLLMQHIAHMTSATLEAKEKDEKRKTMMGRVARSNLDLCSQDSSTWSSWPKRDRNKSLKIGLHELDALVEQPGCL